jgi:hypothetical protein
MVRLLCHFRAPSLGSLPAVVLVWKQRSMLNAAQHYELESTRAFEAAKRAATIDERIRLLARAHEYARWASAERKHSNVHAFDSYRR